MRREKVLVIDDDPLVLRSVSRILACQGYEAATAQSNEAALDQAVKDHFPVILSDIRMPARSGVPAVQKIEELYRSRNQSCRVIFLTGFAEDEDPERGVKTVGVADLMMKPFDARRLIGAIEDELELMREKGLALSA